MSYINKFLVLTLSGFVLLALGLAANAQCAPILSVPPVGLGLVPLGNAGNGITTQATWSSGVGGAASTDSFVNGFVGPSAFQTTGLPFGFGFDGCAGGLGFPSAFSSGGPFQTGVGGNFGTQNSAASGGSVATSFGLQPLGGLAFGIPVAAPGGLVFT